MVEHEYNKRGYRMVAQLYNSKYWGVPQNRERYFILGIRDGVDIDFAFPQQQEDYVPKLSNVLQDNVDETYYIDDAKAQKIIAQAFERLDKLGGVHACITPDRLERRQQGRRAKPDEEEMFTLTAQDLHRVTVQRPHGYNQGGIHDIAPTLTRSGWQCNNHLICKETGLLNPEGVAKTLRVGGKGSISKKHNYEHVLVENYRVRKLTPREYARLQGFSDDYEIVVSNSQAYKQFGNAVTVKLSKAIGDRFRQVIPCII